MQAISFPWMFDVIQAIQNLDGLTEAPVSENWLVLFAAQNQLAALFDQSIYKPHLRVSREKARLLHEQIVMALGDGQDLQRILPKTTIWGITRLRNEFQQIFLSEISVLPAFLVSPKESYDLSVLLYDGTRLFPSEMALKVSEAVFDGGEAGKALAFELPTACGFHVFRVVEAVMRKYWDHVSEGVKRPVPFSIGRVAQELETKRLGESKVWETLSQIAKLHRNPIMHPEVVLSLDEVIGTIGISRSVVGAMLAVMPNELPTTGSGEAKL